MKFIRHTTISPQHVNHPDSTVLKKILVPKGIIPSITNISFAIIKPTDHVPIHSHDSLYEIFLLKHGTLTFVINGNSISASEGDCIIIEPGDTHKVINTTNSDAELFYFGYTVQ